MVVNRPDDRDLHRVVVASPVDGDHSAVEVAIMRVDGDHSAVEVAIMAVNGDRSAAPVRSR
ncbi:MAG: hypothetical protein ACFCVG_10370 [Kineosporiaceae bacterium]